MPWSFAALSREKSEHSLKDLEVRRFADSRDGGPNDKVQMRPIFSVAPSSSTDVVERCLSGPAQDWSNREYPNAWEESSKPFKIARIPGDHDVATERRARHHQGVHRR